MKYITVSEAVEKWGVSRRAITYHLIAGRISGAVKKGSMWLIPEGAARPEDKRRKKSLIQKKDEPEICKKISDLYEQRRNGGTMLVANEEYLKFAKISTPERLYKKHNILLNPNLERWGVKDFVLRAFQGEAVHAYDVKVPHQEIIERLGDNKEMVSGSMFHNMTALPIRDSNNQLLYIVFIFITSRSYQDREEIIKGKEYIDDHWKEEFDIDKLTGIVYMSRYHYTRLFKQHTGMTPYNYYQDVKIGRLKEKLCDINLSITQVFDECGVDYNGSFAKKFKQKVGMTPSQYRAMMTQK